MFNVLTVALPPCRRWVCAGLSALLATMLGSRAARAHEPADSVAQLIARVLAGDPMGASSTRRWSRVQGLYAPRENAAVWLADATGRARGAVLLDSVANAPAQGMRLDGYMLAEARAALAEASSSGSPETIARTDVLLTSIFVAYAEDLLSGQIDPRTVNRQWHIDPQNVDVDSALVQTLRQTPFGESLARLRPEDPDYASLVEALARYRAIVARGGWVAVPGGAALRPGGTSTAERLGALLARLAVEGYIPVAPLTLANAGGASATGIETPVRFDEALASAVAAFQRHHSLAVDSVLGPNTLAALNRPAEYRVHQIVANLERHRWLPRTLGERYVIVNVPAFRLRAYDRGDVQLAMNVVVGADYGARATPVFSDSMAYVVFRPYWNVPASIADAELWPHQRRDPRYFGRNGYEVARASWGRYVRQRPGPGNALGYVKFIFPNDFNIYLHDTPAKALFDRDIRAFSHGCIRVAEPAQLAAWVLGWEIERAQTAMDGGANDTRVNLDRKLPVYIAYFTTYLRDGTVHFANDIYDRDDPLLKALAAT